jgi:hypothetical protein
MRAGTIAVARPAAAIASATRRRLSAAVVRAQSTSRTAIASRTASTSARPVARRSWAARSATARSNPARVPRFMALADGEPEEALDELVGGDAGLVDDEEPISGSGCAAHRRPPRAAARRGLTCISTRQNVQRSAFENVRSSGASPSSMSSPSLPASAGVLNPQRRQQTW